MILFEIDATKAKMVLDPMDERIKDQTPMFRHLLTMALNDAVLAIITQGAEHPPGWPAMAAFTQVKPVSMGGPRDPGTLLNETGDMMETLHEGASGNVFEVGPEGGHTGIFRWTLRGPQNVARLQQYGTKKIPGRVFLAWWQENVPWYTAVVKNYIEGTDTMDIQA